MNALSPAAPAAPVAGEVPPALKFSIAREMEIIGGALLVGGAFTQSPTAVAVSAALAPPAVSRHAADAALDGLQLPDPFLDGSDAGSAA